MVCIALLCIHRCAQQGFLGETALWQSLAANGVRLADAGGPAESTDEPTRLFTVRFKHTRAAEGHSTAQRHLQQVHRDARDDQILEDALVCGRQVRSLDNARRNAPNAKPCAWLVGARVRYRGCDRCDQSVLPDRSGLGCYVPASAL